MAGGNDRQKLIDRVAGGDRLGPLVGFLATTYELQGDFLETDWLPSLLGLGAWEDRSWAGRIALERALCGLDCATVIMDGRRYRGRPRSLRLRLVPAIAPRGEALHAKFAVMLFERGARVILGSANLTEQGFRKNREVAAVLEAGDGCPAHAGVMAAAVGTAAGALARWLSRADREFLTRAEGCLKGIGGGRGQGDVEVIWSGTGESLWRSYLDRWPSKERVRAIKIVSPFWSEDADGTLGAFLRHLKRGGKLAKGAEVLLMTESDKACTADSKPVLPAAFAQAKWEKLRVTVRAIAIDPVVRSEEVDGGAELGLRRDLHAKVVRMVGSKTVLTYAGSANFTAHGWGFGGRANIEVGLAVRESLPGPSLGLLPPTAGYPVVLSGGAKKLLGRPELHPADRPWPTFLRAVELVPSQRGGNRLDLRIEWDGSAVSGRWSMSLNEPGNPRRGTPVYTGPADARGERRPLLKIDERTLDRLLTQQEVWVQWEKAPAGVPFPINVAAEAQMGLPISPDSSRSVGEDDLLAYYQGRIAWEAMFPENGGGGGFGTGNPPGDKPVDTSRIQSYMIRDFVEALPGIRSELEGVAAGSEAAMRFALFGPVSPVALANRVVGAVGDNKRTPTAAAFQLVELCGCLRSAVGKGGGPSWVGHVREAEEKISEVLDRLCRDNARTFAPGGMFSRYRRAVLRRGRAR